MKHTIITTQRTMTVGLVLALVLSLLLIGSAMAHAKLVSSEPQDGAKLDAPPAKITLVFNEELGEQESNFTVTDAAGKQVGDGKLDLNDLDRKTLTGTLDAGAGNGVYSVNWVGYTPDDKEAAAPTTQPTVAPTAAPAAGGSPSTLPHTGAADLSLVGMLVLAALIVLAGGLVLRSSKRRG